MPLSNQHRVQWVAAATPVRLIGLDILRLGSHKLPNLIALQAAYTQIADEAIMELRTGDTGIFEQTENGMLCHQRNEREVEGDPVGRGFDVRLSIQRFTSRV